METLNKGTIFFMEKNIHGAWVVYGVFGVKQCYGYTKAQAKKIYLESDRIFTNQKNS